MIEWLRDPALREQLTIMALGLTPIVLLCGALSPIVVLKKSGLLAQAVGHTAFTGVGLAAVLGWTAGGSLTLAGETTVLVVGLLAGAIIGIRSRTTGGASAYHAVRVLHVVIVARHLRLGCTPPAPTGTRSWPPPTGGGILIDHAGHAGPCLLLPGGLLAQRASRNILRWNQFNLPEVICDSPMDEVQEQMIHSVSCENKT